MFGKLTKWLIFSVFLALVPLAVSLLFQFTHTKQVNLETSLAHGELLLITAVICASSMGELFGAGPRYKIPKILSGGASVLIFLFTVIYFADVSANNFLNSAIIDKFMVCKISIILFISAFFTSACCITLSEV